MIVITGCSRTGTSLVMQTLKLLGVKIAGYKYLEEFGPKELYPKGCYDLPFKETINGLNTDKYKGYAVKLFPGQLFKTKAEYIDKIIICKRDKEKTVKSIIHSMQIFPKNFGLMATEDNAKKLFDLSYKMIEDYLNIHTAIHRLSIKYEDMIKNKVSTVNMIKDFVNSKFDIKKTVLNIDNGGGI